MTLASVAESTLTGQHVLESPQRTVLSGLNVFNSLHHMMMPNTWHSRIGNM